MPFTKLDKFQIFKFSDMFPGTKKKKTKKETKMVCFAKLSIREWRVESRESRVKYLFNRYEEIGWIFRY